MRAIIILSVKCRNGGYKMPCYTRPRVSAVTVRVTDFTPMWVQCRDQDWCFSDKRTLRRSAHAPPGAAPSALLLIFHVTPMRGVFPHKKGLEGWLNLLCKNRTLLIHLHRLKRVPDADGEAAVGIIDILRQPPAPQAGDRFARHGGMIGLFIGCPGAGPQFPLGNAHDHDRVLLVILSGQTIERHLLLYYRSEEHTSELQSPCNLVCRLLLEKQKKTGPVPCINWFAEGKIRSLQPILTVSSLPPTYGTRVSDLPTHSADLSRILRTGL